MPRYHVETHRDHRGKLVRRKTRIAAAIYKSISSLRTRHYKWLRTDVFKKTLLKDLKEDAAAIQAIYDFPLTTEAADKLNRQLRSGISPDDLANLVTTLHRDDRLVVANLHDAPAKEPRILCSLGLA